MLLSTITAGTLPPRIATRRANGRSDGTDDDDHQGEVLEAAEPCGEALRDARLLLRAAARATPEREARSRRPDGRYGRGDPACAGQDRRDAVSRGRNRRADGVGRARGFHLRPDPTRPRARADGFGVPG